MRRSKRLLAAGVVASLLGSSVAWAAALWLAPLGAYDVALHMDDGRFAIVLDRRPPTDAPRQGDPAMNDDDGLHDEYVVTIATLDVCSTADAGRSAKACGPAIATRINDVTQLAAPLPLIVAARAGPPSPPVSFSILRI